MEFQRAEGLKFLSVDQISFFGMDRLVCPGDQIVQIWGVLLAGCSSTVAMCSEWLSVQERTRVGRFVRQEDAIHYILAHGCLRLVLSRYIGCDPSAVTFQIGVTGKPALVALLDGQKHVYFNLSHSHGRMLIAVAQDQEVGVDLEQVRDGVDVIKLAERFYAPAEQRALFGEQLKDQHEKFYCYWVAKETFLKYKGLGLQFPLDRVEVSLGSNGDSAIVEWRPDGCVPEQAVVRFLPLEEGWVGGVTAKGSDWKFEICEKAL